MTYPLILALSIVCLLWVGGFSDLTLATSMPLTKTITTKAQQVCDTINMVGHIVWVGALVGGLILLACNRPQWKWFALLFFAGIGLSSVGLLQNWIGLSKSSTAIGSAVGILAGH